MPEGERKARGCSQGSGEMEGTRKRFSGKEDSKEKPRVKVWENIGHTPRGGNVKVSMRNLCLTTHCCANCATTLSTLLCKLCASECHQCASECHCSINVCLNETAP